MESSIASHTSKLLELSTKKIDQEKRPKLLEEMHCLAEEEKGKKEIAALLKNDKTIACCTVAFLPAEIAKCYRSDLIGCIPESLSETHCQQLADLITNIRSFHTFVKENDKKDFRMEWFGRHKNGSHRINEIESLVISIQLCLAIRDRVSMNGLSKLWGRKLRPLGRDKNALKLRFTNFLMPKGLHEEQHHWRPASVKKAMISIVSPIKKMMSPVSNGKRSNGQTPATRETSQLSEKSVLGNSQDESVEATICPVAVEKMNSMSIGFDDLQPQNPYRRRIEDSPQKGTSQHPIKKSVKKSKKRGFSSPQIEFKQTLSPRSKSPVRVKGKPNGQTPAKPFKISVLETSQDESIKLEVSFRRLVNVLAHPEKGTSQHPIKKSVKKSKKRGFSSPQIEFKQTLSPLSKSPVRVKGKPNGQTPAKPFEISLLETAQDESIELEVSPRRIIDALARPDKGTSQHPIKESVGKSLELYVLENSQDESIKIANALPIVERTSHIDSEWSRNSNERGTNGNPAKVTPTNELDSSFSFGSQYSKEEDEEDPVTADCHGTLPTENETEIIDYSSDDSAFVPDSDCYTDDSSNDEPNNDFGDHDDDSSTEEPDDEAEEEGKFRRKIDKLGLGSAVDAVLATGRKARKFAFQNPKGGQATRYSQIPVSSSRKRFAKNAKETEWIQNVVNMPGNENLTETQKAAYLFENLLKFYPDLLDVSAEECGIRGLNRMLPMDAHKTLAMMNEANMTYYTLRVVKRYIWDHFKIRFTAPEERIREITAHLVEPIHGTVKIDETIITYWYRPITNVVLNLFKHEFKDLEFHECKVILGGDHGVGVFHMSIKVVLYRQDGTIAREAIEKVGHINNGKDTYQVLNETIMQPLEESLALLEKSALRIPKDCALVTFIPLTECNSSNDSAFRIITLIVAATGDLAWVNTMQGKENMSSKWCPYCDLHPNEFKNIDHNPGNLWTLESMARTRNFIASGVYPAKDKARLQKGCTRAPLSKVLQPQRYKPPVLHVMMGGFNFAIKGLYDYADARHEKVPEKERKKRIEYFDAMDILDSLEEEFKSLEDPERIKHKRKECISEKKKFQDLKNPQERFPCTCEEDPHPD
ncbi:unnamed protein product [Cylindrotheca closterium]|uniref:Uncharacterized protein n=1 Tax=Cylindrotheca closterium TaxID=2856 RepID=A0AAD2PWQ1_9STRA|nr:unnamed protein product [Cylindrotheca closterium]